MPCSLEPNKERRVLSSNLNIDMCLFLLQSQRDSTYTRIESARESRDWTPRHNYRPPGGSGIPHHFYGPPMDAARITTSSRDDPPSVSNASEMQAEWVEEDEPGVHITIRQLPDGTRELRRVRFR